MCRRVCLRCFKTLRFVDTRVQPKKIEIEILAAGTVCIRRGHTKYTGKEIRFKIQLHAGTRSGIESAARKESHEMIDTVFCCSSFLAVNAFFCRTD